MTSLRDLDDLAKVRQAWPGIVHGATWPISIGGGVLFVLCPRAAHAEALTERSDFLAAKINECVRPMLVTRVEGHHADAATILLARQIAELEELLRQGS